MTTRFGLALAVGLGVLITPSNASAHGGGLDSLGCHNDRKRGGYHCHRGALAGKYFSSKSQAFDALRGRRSSYIPPKSPTTSGIAQLPQEVVSRGELIRASQLLLTALGYEPGPADGSASPATEAAIRAFQSEHAVTSDGQVSGALLVRLSEAVLARR